MYTVHRTRIITVCTTSLRVLNFVDVSVVEYILSLKIKYYYYIMHYVLKVNNDYLQTGGQEHLLELSA